MNQWQKQAAKELREKQALTAEVAKLLGDGWRVDEKSPDVWGKLRFGKDLQPALCVGFVRGRGLYISERKGKYHVSLMWPHGAFALEYHPANETSIGVSISRGAAALADDIKRRLLVTYFDEYAEQLKLAQASLDAQAAREKTFTDLLGIVDGKPSEQNLRECSTRVYHHDVVDLRVNESGNTVQLSFSGLSIKAARDILKYAAKHNPK